MSDFSYYAFLVLVIGIGFIGGARAIRSKVDGLLYIGVAALLAMGLGQ